VVEEGNAVLVDGCSGVRRLSGGGLPVRVGEEVSHI